MLSPVEPGGQALNAAGIRIAKAKLEEPRKLEFDFRGPGIGEAALLPHLQGRAAQVYFCG